MKIKNNKILIIVLSVVVGILALGGIVTAFILNYNVFSPEKVEILDDGHNIYISTTANDNYKAYRFKFVDSQNNEIIVDSENNIMSLSELIEEGVKIGETYMVSTCYLSDNDGNNSQYSKEISWDVYTYLDSPILNYDEEKGSLSWSQVDNADYYKVFYNNENDIISYQTTEFTLDLQTINGGQREFYVVAYSNNKSYKQSNKSNAQQIKVIHKLKEFSKITFDSQSKILSIYGEEELEKFYVYIDGSSYEIIDFDVEYVTQTNQYIFTVDISLIYNDSSNIGASPMSIDEYNIFDGNITYVDLETE